MSIIDELIIRFLQGRASSGEEENLQRWRSTASEHESRFRAIEGVWSLTDVVSPSWEVESKLDADFVIGRAEAQAVRRLTPAAGSRKRSISSSRVGLRGRFALRRAAWLAASIAIVSLGVSIYSYRWLAPGQITYSEIVTGEGELATFTLSDGTAIRVGPQSTLTISWDHEQTTVQLDGRAFFGVHPDRSRLFTVRTRYGEATALGTRFEVHTDDRDFRVLVVEGNVRVSSTGTSLELSGGLMGQSRDGGPLSTTMVDDLRPLLDWMGTTVMFRNTPLRAAIAEIADRYDAQLYLRDPGLGDLAVTATFTDQSLDHVVFVICEMIAADCVTEVDGRIRIGPQVSTGRRPAMPTPADAR